MSAMPSSCVQSAPGSARPHERVVRATAEDAGGRPRHGVRPVVRWSVSLGLWVVRLAGISLLALVAWRAMDNVPLFAVLRAVVRQLTSDEAVPALVRGEAPVIAMIFGLIVLTAATALALSRQQGKRAAPSPRQR